METGGARDAKDHDEEITPTITEGIPPVVAASGVPISISVSAATNNNARWGGGGRRRRA